MQTLAPCRKTSTAHRHLNQCKNAWLICLLCFISTCGPTVYEQKLQSEVTKLQELAANNAKALQELQQRHDHDVGRIWGKVNCTNDQVRDFIRRCEGPGNAGCSEQSIASALAFMNTQPYTLAYLRPEAGMNSLVSIRKGQILELSDSHNIFPTTRFLILVQPRGETAKLLEEASLIGNQVLQFLRVDMRLPTGVQILGPHLLPCKLKADTINGFSGRLDRTQPGEPPDPKNRIRIWIFRTDCGGA